MSSGWNYSWSGWNVLEVPKPLAEEILNLKIYMYQADNAPRLSDVNLYKEHVSKLLQQQKREDFDSWIIYYSHPISEELREALNATQIGKKPRPITNFSPREATALMTKYLQNRLGKRLAEFTEEFQELSELRNEDLGIATARKRVPEVKVIGYGGGKIKIALRYRVESSPTINLWELKKSSLRSLVGLLDRQLKEQKPIRIKSPRAKSGMYSYLVRILAGEKAKEFLEKMLYTASYQKIKKSIRSIHPDKNPLDSEYVFIAVPSKKYSKTFFSLCGTPTPSDTCLRDTLIFTELNTQLVVDTAVESMLFGEESDFVQWRKEVLKKYQNAISHFSRSFKFHRVFPAPILVPDQKILMVKTDKGERKEWGLRKLILKGSPSSGVFDDAIVPFTSRNENLRIFVYYPANIKSEVKNSLFEKRLESLANGIYAKAFTGVVEVSHRPINGISWGSLRRSSTLDEYSHKILTDIESNLGGHNDSHLIITVLPDRKELVRFYNLRTKLLKEYDRKIAVQGIQFKGLNDAYRSYSSLLQTAPKLGVYFYSLDPANPGVNNQNYYLLLGIDVTRRHEATQRSLAASVVLMTPEGIPKGTVVFPQDTNRESVDLFGLFKDILTHRVIRREIRKKKVGVLLARDGFVTKKEEGSIEPILMEFPNLELDMVEIVKETGTRVWLSNNFRPSYVRMPYGEIDQYLVVAHRGMKVQNSSFVRAYAIRRYYHATDVESNTGPHTAPVSLVHYLIYLHRLNYTTYMDSVISLPAPVHFAHKCSNFIRKFGIEKIPIDNALFFV